MTTLNELLSPARRSSVVNHLKNGNFLNVPKQFTAVNNVDSVLGRSQVFRTNYAYDVTTNGSSPSTTERLRVPGFYVPSTEPQENFIGYWSVWGVAGVVSFNDVSESFDGGNLVGVEFNEKGIIQFKQVISSFDKFRGKTVALALSGRTVRGDAKIVLKIDTGAGVVESRPFFARYFKEYYRMVVSLDVGLDITKFDVTISIEALPQALVGISGAMLALGPHKSVLSYADSPSDVAIPSGTIVLSTGASCPPGFRAIADDGYLYAVLGDPNAIRGNMNSEYNGVTISSDPEIGENRHDHQSSGPNELQPAAFDVLEGRFTTASVLVEETPVAEVRPILAYEADEDDGDVYFGIREQVLPTDHSHVYVISGETVEPPRAIFKICEKI
jgi:hypothetical protein